jgi:hypothetical protein
LRTGFSALLWVELDRAHVFLFQDGDKLCSVAARSYHFFAKFHCGIRVRKIEVGVRVDALKQLGFVSCDQAIPAHVGQFDDGRQRSHAPRQQLKTSQLRRLLAGVVEGLKTETDPEEWNAAAEGIYEGRPQFAVVKHAYKGFEMTYARE